MTAVLAWRPSVAIGARRAPLPGVVAGRRSRRQVELKAFFRERQSVVFIFAMPAVMLVLLGAIFGKQGAGHGVTIGDLYVAGLIGGGVMAISYQNLGHVDRVRACPASTLKRLRGTPMPAAAYFVGKIIQVLVTAVAEVAVLLVVGLAFYHLRLPAAAAWWTFAWEAFGARRGRLLAARHRGQQRAALGGA